MEEAKSRIISAALLVAKAERGGLDGGNAYEELARANRLFDEALEAYANHMDRPR